MRRGIWLYILLAIASPAAAQSAVGSVYAWMTGYAGRPASQLARDPLFEPMLALSVPAWSVGMGPDRTLANALATQMRNSSRRVDRREGRYLEFSGYRKDGGVAQSLFWVDLQQGRAIGAMYVCLGPVGGCAQQMLVFSSQFGQVSTVANLPGDFVAALAGWQAKSRSGPPDCHFAQCQMPAALTQYFIGPAGRPSLLLHQAGSCAPAPGDARCRAAEREASELDLNAAFAAGSAEPTEAAAAEESAWLAQRDQDCGAAGAVPDCFSRANEMRAAKLLAQLPRPRISAYAPSGRRDAPDSAACTRRTPVYQPDPTYSLAARRARFEGSVQARVSIAPNGQVTHVAITQPIGYGLDQVAMRTLETWRFEPVAAGCPQSDTNALVTLSFHLGPG